MKRGKTDETMRLAGEGIPSVRTRVFRLADEREIRRESRSSGTSLCDKGKFGRIYGLPVSERRKDGGSTKCFSLHDGHEWPRNPSDGRPSKAGGGKKFWNIANLASASPSGGTTKGRCSPHYNSNPAEWGLE